ncbi:MAG: lysophospholipid acyltransferase family protein [Pseudomonadota bacterium]
MTILRSALFNVLFFAWCAIVFVLGVAFALVSRAALAWWARLWVRVVVALLATIVGLSYEVRGHRGALRRPGILAVKHQSAWDTMIFHCLASDPAYVMKEELMAIPIFGWLTRRMGMIPIDRKAGGAALRRLLRAAAKALAAGRQVVLFPQGTRVAPGTQAPYLPGIAALYTKLGRSVVPVALNSGLFWGRRAFLKRPGRIVVEVLPEIPAGLGRREFMAELERRLETASARLAEAPGEPSPAPVIHISTGC